MKILFNNIFAPCVVRFYSIYVVLFYYVFFYLLHLIKTSFFVSLIFGTESVSVDFRGTEKQAFTTGIIRTFECAFN